MKSRLQRWKTQGKATLLLLLFSLETAELREHVACQSVTEAESPLNLKEGWPSKIGGVGWPARSSHPAQMGPSRFKRRFALPADWWATCSHISAVRQARGEGPAHHPSPSSMLSLGKPMANLAEQDVSLPGCSCNNKNHTKVSNSLLDAPNMIN